MEMITQTAVPPRTAVQALMRKKALHHHSMAALNLEPARVLFRQCHGLDQQQLQKLRLLELEGELLQACSGLPLALEVIGGNLKDDSAGDPRKLWQVGQTAFAKGRGREQGFSCRSAACEHPHAA